MRVMIAVGVAGFFGAVARYGVEGLVSSRTEATFPWGTFIVNISGSLLLGVLFAALIEGRLVVSPWLRTATTVGLLGAYTTFSTLSFETFRLIEEGSYMLAVANALGTLAAGMVAMYVGVVAGRWI